MAPAPISPERNIRTLQRAFAVGIAALLAMFGGLQAAEVGPSTSFSGELGDTISAVVGGLSAVGTALPAMVAVAAIFGLLMCGPSVFSNP